MSCDSCLGVGCTLPTHQRSPFRRPRSTLMSYISSVHWGPHPSNGTACKPSRRVGAPQYMSCPAYGVQRQNYWLVPRFEKSTQDRTHRWSSHMGCHGTITRLQRRALSQANEIYMSNARVLCQGKEVAGEDRVVWQHAATESGGPGYGGVGTCMPNKPSTTPPAYETHNPAGKHPTSRAGTTRHPPAHSTTKQPASGATVKHQQTRTPRARVKARSRSKNRTEAAQPQRGAYTTGQGARKVDPGVPSPDQLQRRRAPLAHALPAERRNGLHPSRCYGWLWVKPHS